MNRRRYQPRESSFKKGFGMGCGFLMAYAAMLLVIGLLLILLASL